MTEFNEGQQSLIDAPLDRKVVGVAGAGTGKTTTILARTKRILEEYKTGSILLVTFTRAAANDMQSRLYRQISDNDKRRVIVGTFHSIIGKLIRDQAVAVGLDPSFSVIDESSTITMYQSIIERDTAMFEAFTRLIIGDPPYQKKHVKLIKRDYNAIAGAVSSLVNAAEPEELLTGQFGEHTYERMEKLVDKIPMDVEMTNLLYDVFKTSINVGRQTNTITYDQILFIGYLMTRSGLLKDFSDSLVHMIVDEYQDTNALQDAFVRSIGGDHLTLVGDVDQAIYEFRGGQAQLLVDHANEAQVVNLTRNYRSYQPILDAANTLIDNNQSGRTIRKPLVANTDLDDGFNGILEQDAPRDFIESSAVLDYIQFKIQQGAKPSDIAILVRSRRAINSINRELTKRKVAVNDTTSFADFMKSEVMKDTLNFVKVFTNPKDVYAFMAVMDKPKRGIGPKAIETLLHNAASHGMSIIAYLMSDKIETELKPGLRKNVKEFISIYTDLLDTKHQQMKFPDMIKYLLDKTGYIKWIKSLDEKTRRNHESNLTILDGMVSSFTEEYNENHRDYTLFDIANAFTFEMTSTIKQEDRDGVTVSTIHGSKGLEWKYVFVIGMEDQIFPGPKATDDADIESERRLMYVAITRAKSGLWLCYSRTRVGTGDDILDKSMFLDEIGEHQIKQL